MKRKFIVSLTILVILAVIFATVYLPRLMAPAVPYSTDLKLAERAYVDVTYIFPSYTISTVIDGTDTESEHALVCSCVTTEGETVWLHVLTPVYIEYIDPDSAEYLLNPDRESIPGKSFEEPVRIYGIIVTMDSVCDDLKEDLGQKRILSFTGIE